MNYIQLEPKKKLLGNCLDGGDMELLDRKFKQWKHLYRVYYRIMSSFSASETAVCSKSHVW